MITEHIFYGLRCDRCGEDYDGSECSCYIDKGDLFDAAKEDDWVTIEGCNYCPGCYEWNMDPYCDYDNRYRPKPFYPRSIYKLRKFLQVFGGYRQEEHDDMLIFRFYVELVNKKLEPEYSAMIDKILHLQEYRIEVVDSKNPLTNAEVYIYIRLKRFYKGQRVRVIHHTIYRDSFGKEGEVVQEAIPRLGLKACYGVQLFDEDYPDPLFLEEDYLELASKE